MYGHKKEKLMKRDYTYFCPNDHSETVVWTLEEFEENKDNMICKECNKPMQIDISPRKFKDNIEIGNWTCLNPRTDYSKSAYGRDGRSYF